MNRNIPRDLPVMDTPTRASRLSRPQTRHWKQSITDATNLTTATAPQRARLRAHLAAADRLAAKRRALKLLHKPPKSTSSSKSMKDQQLKPYETKENDIPTDKQLEPQENEAEQQEEEIKPLFKAGAIWSEKADKFTAFADKPTAELAPSVAISAPSALRDLRGKIVLAASRATIASVPFLPTPSVIHLWDASVSGALVSTRLMSEACERAALALVHETVNTDIWKHVIDVTLRGDEHACARKLAVNAITQLVKDGNPSKVDFIVGHVATECLSVAAGDKNVDVRDSGRELVKAVRNRFSEERADVMVTEAIPSSENRERFLKEVNKTSNVPGKGNMQKAGPGGRKVMGLNANSNSQGNANGRQNKTTNKSSNIRELIKARKAAAAAAKKEAEAKSNNQSSENNSVTVSLATKEGNGGAEKKLKMELVTNQQSELKTNDDSNESSHESTSRTIDISVIR